MLPSAWAHADAALRDPNQAAPASVEEREQREMQRLQWLVGVLEWGPRITRQQQHVIREWTLAVYAVRYIWCICFLFTDSASDAQCQLRLAVVRAWGSVVEDGQVELDYSHQ